MTKTPPTAKHILNVDKMTDTVIEHGKAIIRLQEHQDGLNGSIDRIEESISTEVKPGIVRVHKRIDNILWGIIAIALGTVANLVIQLIK